MGRCAAGALADAPEALFSLREFPFSGQKLNLLLASLLALAVGPLLVRAFGNRGGVVAALDGFVLVMLSGLVLMLILPHTFVVAGWWALPAAAFGLVAPTLFERLPFLSRSIADRHAMVMVPALAGLALHAFADGAALTTHSSDHPGAPEDFLALGVLVHRVPLGLIIWSRAGARAGSVLLLWIAVASVLGYFAGGAGLELLSLGSVALFQAFVAGSLLHVALATPVHAGAPLPQAPRFASGLGALLAIGFLLVLSDLHPLEPTLGPIGQMGDTFMHLALESAPALVVGFAGAGILQAVLRSRSAHWLTARTRPAEALKGMTFGLPLPLCSCSVLPVYRTLVGSGAPVPGAVAFLIATPEIGLDAFFLSLPLLGTDLALTRLAGAAFVAFAAAMLLATFVRRGNLEMRPVPQDSESDDERDGKPFAVRIREGLRFGLGELFDHTMPWILMGLVVAAALAPALEGSWLADLPWGVDVLTLAVLGVPGYVCASGATPMVAMMIAGGLSPGAAIAFLITGPATNVTTIGVLSQLHGRSFAMAFAAVVPALAIALGFTVNALMGDTGAGPAMDPEHEPGLLQWLCLMALGLLLTSSLVRRGPRGLLAEVSPALDDHDHCEEDENCAPAGHAH